MDNEYYENTQYNQNITDNENTTGTENTTGSENAFGFESGSSFGNVSGFVNEGSFENGNRFGNEGGFENGNRFGNEGGFENGSGVYNPGTVNPTYTFRAEEEYKEELRQKNLNSQNETQQSFTPAYENYRAMGGPSYFTQGPANTAPVYNTAPVQPSAPVKEKPGRAGKFFRKLGTAALCGLLFGVLAGGAFFGTRALYYHFNPEATAVETEKTAESGSTLILDPVVDSSIKVETTQLSTDVSLTSTDVSAVVEATMPSVVTISGTFAVNSWFGYYESEGSGSGIIVGENENELLIATNNHVVADSLSLKATLTDGTSYDASIKGTDAVADLAVIAIKRSDIPEETYSAIRIATLGDSDSVKVGQMAIAIGNALGYGQSTTVGYISAVDREVNIDGQTMVLLQTDAAINPGNSGGALLNINGEVIGINSVKYASSDVEGMGFAIPISRAMTILDELMTREELAEDEKGYLGVYITDVTSDMATAYNWPIGIYVSQVIKGGAAEKAGIYTGDIITAINQATVTTCDTLKEKVNSYRVGTTIDVTLQRLINGEYQELTIPVTLGGASR